MTKRMVPEKRKEFILEIAKDLFSKNGYYETQIHDIVTKAGISRGTIYQYFKNKDDVYMTLLENFYNTWLNEMKLSLQDEDLKTINAVDYFKKRIKRTLTFFANDHKMSNIVLRITPGLGKGFGAIVNRLDKKIKAIIAEDIKLGLKSGNIKEDIDIELTSESIAGAVLRISYSYLIKNRKQKGSLTIDELTDKVVDLFATGLIKY